MSDTQHTAEEQLPADKCLSVKCLHCEQSFPVALAASVPDEQRMSIEISHESPFISARTLGEVMSNMNDLLIAVAKDHRLKGRGHGRVVRTQQRKGND